MSSADMYDFKIHFIHNYIRYLTSSLLRIFDIHILHELEKTIAQWTRLILFLGNDIEEDPGPLFSKCSQGSSDQSHPKFGENRGMLCSYIIVCHYIFLYQECKQVDQR